VLSKYAFQGNLQNYLFQISQGCGPIEGKNQFNFEKVIVQTTNFEKRILKEL